MTFFCYFRSLRRANLNSTQISIALDEIPSDSDISGAGDDSDNDNTYRPRGEAVEDTSDEEEEAEEGLPNVEEGPVILKMFLLYSRRFTLMSSRFLVLQEISMTRRPNTGE